ncbi:MAG: aminotransferase class IV [Planctomycetes bacterium]|nr:aminotransferase class IV [Planctomycetota bacterium]
MAAMLISIDRQSVAPEAAMIPVLDHGFLFGDSVYEVVRTWQGKLLFHEEHFARLENSAAGIALPLPLSCDELRAEFERLHQESGFEESYLRVIITRGVGALELAIASCDQQRTICIAKPLTVWPAAFYAQGARLAIVSVVRNSRRATNPAFKTGNYLNNVLAIEEAKAVQATEALMLNAAEQITECSTSNVFFVKDGQIHTPALGVGILPGITRAKVCEVAKSLGLDCHEGEYSLEELLAADEVFITSTTRDVMPISEFAIGEVIRRVGDPGEVTLCIAQAYRELCDASTQRRAEA